MNTLLALLLSSVSLSWVQPPNPGWAASCGTAPCLTHYTIVDKPANTTFSVPYGALSFSAPAAPGIHNYWMVLNGINAAGTGVSSSPAAAVSVAVPQYVIDVCPPGTLNLPTGTIKPGGQSAIASFKCPGAIQPSSGVVGDSAVWTWATDPRTVTGWKPNPGGHLEVLAAVVSGQVNFVLVNYTNMTFVVTPAQITVRVLR